MGSRVQELRASNLHRHFCSLAQVCFVRPKSLSTVMVKTVRHTLSCHLCEPVPPINEGRRKWSMWPWVVMGSGDLLEAWIWPRSWNTVRAQLITLVNNNGLIIQWWCEWYPHTVPIYSTPQNILVELSAERRKPRLWIFLSIKREGLGSVRKCEFS